MTRARLIAIGAAVFSSIAGSIIFIDSDSGRQVSADAGVGFQFLNRDSCSVSACGTNACQQANDIWADAGQTCTARLASCDVKISPGARAWAAANSLTLPAKDYARVIFIGARCAVAGGGFAGAIPLDNAGLPQFVTIAQAPAPCVRAPLDGGIDCRRDEHDGGSRFIGAGNVFSIADAVGTQCEAVLSCSVFFGDDPASAL